MMDVRGSACHTINKQQNIYHSPSTTTEEEEEMTVTVKSKKRSHDEDYYLKKRRKQLKPIRITSFDDDDDEMVKVPINNISEMSKLVPPKNLEKSPIPRNRSPLKDVLFQNDSEDTVEVRDDTDLLHVPSRHVGPIATNTNLLFPYSYSSQEFVTNTNYWQDKMRIFNQEAYCELCKKEFCNKYFLKTHKANKHGIFLDLSVSKKESDEISSLENEHSSEDKMKAFCDVCNRRFCNKYFVRRHKTKSHGLVTTEDSSEGTSDYCQDEDKKKENGRDGDEGEEKGLEKEEDNHVDVEGEDQESPLNLIINDNVAETNGTGKADVEEGHDVEEEGDGDEEECSSENLEKLQTMLLRLNPSDLVNKEFYEKTDEESSEELKEESSDYIINNKMENCKQRSQPPPTSSYCEICNKELCNKYFMRTHMQRMHGIEIEHGTQIGGVVCNICNKELCSKYFLRVHKQNTHGVGSPTTLPSTSTTQTSHKETTNDKFYQNFTQVCFICNRRFRSPKWLQAHLLSDHREEITSKSSTKDDVSEETLKIPKHEENKNDPPSSNVVSKLFWEQDGNESNTYNCSQCSFSTSVLAFLFVHERSHFILPSLQQMTQSPEQMVKPSLALQNLIQSKTFWQHKITQVNDCLDLSMKSVVDIETKKS